MLIKRIEAVPAVPVRMEGAKNVSVRVLFGPEDKAPTFAMRLFVFDKAGNTPYHSHPFEHQVIVLEGEILVVTEKDKVPLSPGDVVMIMPGEIHQFKNISDSKPARFICLIPAKHQK